MATYTDIRPLRDYSEHFVLNQAGVSGFLVNKGTFVVMQGSGLNPLDQMTLDDNSWLPSVLSARFNVPTNMVPAPSGTVAGSIVGMTIKTVQTVDENGLPLKFFPDKAALLDVVISGQSCPVVSAGDFLYSGFQSGSVVAAGTGLAVSDDGQGGLKSVSTVTTSGALNPAVVAVALGPINSQGFAYIRLTNLI